MMSSVGRVAVLSALLFSGAAFAGQIDTTTTTTTDFESDTVVVPQSKQSHRKLDTPKVAFPIQTYFIPLPEESCFKDMFYQINPEKARPGIETMLSMAISTDNTVIWYDHWEDGYEPDVTNSTSSTTSIWGDGLASNGCPPDVDPCTDDADVLNAGRTIVIQNNIPLPRDPANLFYDGSDRIQASYPIAITRGAYPKQPGSLMAGAVEVLDTDSWGLTFEAPLGMDIGKYFQAFQFSAFFFMAGEDNTVVTLPDETTITLQMGEASFIYVNQRDHISSSKKIQVDLITGDVWSYYELRWYSMIALEDWERQYVSSVGDSVGKTKVLLYNPNPDRIEVDIEYLEGGTTRKTVTTAVSSGRAVLSHVIPTGSGAVFTADANFMALSLTDTEFTTSTGQKTGSQWYDWGFPVIPRNHLTPTVLIGWGYGCTDNKCYGQEDRSVVWITAVEDADVFVDYNNIGSNYTTFQMDALQSVKVTDNGDDDMSGAIIFATQKGTGPEGPDVDIAAAWGQDPAVSEKYQSISLDLGTVVLPFSIVRVTKNVDKEVVLPGEILTYTIRVSNVGNKVVGANTLRLFDMLDEHVTYIEGSASHGGGDDVYSLADDDQGLTKFPLDGTGHMISADIPRRGGTYDFSFKALVDEYDNLRHDKIENFGRVQRSTGGFIPYRATSTVNFRADIDIINKVYLGHDGGESCDTNKAVDKVQGDVGDAVTYCFKVTNIGMSHLKEVVVTNGELVYENTSINQLAPGDSDMLYIQSTITQDLVNTAKVVANPVFVDGNDIPSLQDVTDEDPSEVEKIAYSPNIQVENTVYLGNDNGAQCETNGIPQEKVASVNGADVVYCFLVTNNGDTHLNQVFLDNFDLTFTDSSSFGLLAPGDFVMLHYQTKINGDLVNHADVVGNPVNAEGTDLLDVDNVRDSDPSEVAMSAGAPAIKIINRVYLGDDNGESCNTNRPVEKVQGFKAESVVYCFEISNVGNSHLDSVKLNNPDLNFSDEDSIGLLAPGDLVIRSYQTTISGDLENQASVTANPVESDGTDMVGFDDVHDNDPSEVVEIIRNALVEIENTVYLGHNAGESCETDQAVERVTGELNTLVTYCFKIINNGSTSLSSIVIGNEVFSFTDSSIGVLVPHASVYVYYEWKIEGNLHNHATVTAMPSDSSGNPLAGAEQVSDTDPSEVALMNDGANISIENTVYKGTDKGQSCNTDIPVDLYEGLKGDPIIFCLRVANNGATYLTDVRITDSQLQFTDTSSVGLLPPAGTHVVALWGYLTASFNNTAVVTASPAQQDGTKIDNLDDVTDSDPSGVVKLEDLPGLEIHNKVYLGHNSGSSCNTAIATDAVEAYSGTDVTYCFLVKNTGTTYLTDITLGNQQLGFSDQTISGLAPNSTGILWLQKEIDDDYTNKIVVTAKPANADGSVIDGVSDVQGDDTSSIQRIAINPSVDIQNTVYAGHDDGQSCSGNLPSEQVDGYYDDEVTYCYKVTNTGDTYLKTIIIDETELSFTDLSIGLLPPGSSSTVPFQSKITKDHDSVVKVTATPAKATGDTILNAPDVTSTDPAKVRKLEYDTGVDIVNKVYLGHDSGQSCGTDVPSDSVTRQSGSKVTYCLTITNTGETHLGDIKIDDSKLDYYNDGAGLGVLPPGNSTTVSIYKLITDNLENVGRVTANPVSSEGTDLAGTPDVSDTDNSNVELEASNPGISVDNTVYIGSDGGTSCGTSKAKKDAEGYNGDYVTYCFLVKNTGDSHLNSITVHNSQLSFTDLSIGLLAPQDEALVIFAGVIDGDLQNVVQVAANPVTPSGEDIVGTDDVTASSPSEVKTKNANPRIIVDNTVYKGDDNGEACSTSTADNAQGYYGESVVYCFKVTNTGDTLLTDVTLYNVGLDFFDDYTIETLQPNESVIIPLVTTIDRDLDNTVTVNAIPVTPEGVEITGVGEVTASDPSSVDKLDHDASILIENTVYLGHDGGASCGTSKAESRAAGYNGADVTYCFEVTNTGVTHLDTIVIDDTVLAFYDNSIGLLAPQASSTVTFEGVIDSDLKNFATVTANPVTVEGEDLGGTDDVTDTDPSEVGILEHQSAVTIQNTVYPGHNGGASCGTDLAVDQLEGYEDDEVTYCLTVTNSGDTSLNEVTVVDSALSFRDTTSIGLLPPGGTQTITVERTIDGNRSNEAVVTANPVSSTGEDIDGAEDVTDSDPSVVVMKAASPAIDITNTVYVGDDNGDSCSSDIPTKQVQDYVGKKIVYCFLVKNLGDTYLKDVVIVNSQLGLYDDNSVGTLAPDASIMVPLQRTIDDDLVNTADVSATPVTADEQKINGAGEVTDSDTSKVVKQDYDASITIENTVYLGTNGGDSCDTDIPQEKVVGFNGRDVTYCFKVTNTGQTSLNTIVIEDKSLGFTDHSINMLPPGASDYVYLHSLIVGPHTNVAVVTANPVSSKGDDLPGVDDVTDSDPSQVDKLSHDAEINIENTVYPGHDEGQSCHTATEEHEGLINDDVTFCLLVTNTGNTYLDNVVVDDEKLAFTDSTTIGLLAPGDSAWLTVQRKIHGPAINVANVQARAVEPSGDPIDGVPEVTSADTSKVLVGENKASIKIENTVYLGNDYGDRCTEAGERAQGMIGDDIVFCYKITNTGQTYLKKIYIEHAASELKDNSIGILGPGDFEIVPFPTKIQGNLTNIATVTANPVEQDGTDIPALDDVTDSDPSEVVESHIRDDGLLVKTSDKDPFMAPTIETPQQCAQDNAPVGSELVCVEKQVYLDTVASDVASCVVGEQITVDIDASIHVNGDRYDVGWYVATDGGDSLEGTCVVNAFQSGNEYKVVDSPGGSSEVGTVVFDQDAAGGNDTCGDVFIPNVASGNIDIPIVVNTPITCSDEDEDGSLDFSICFVWKTAETDGVCTIQDATTVQPGSTDSCYCTRYNIPTISVITQLDDPIAPCR